MLSRRYRFHSRGGVRYTYQHGVSVRQPKISLVCAKNTRGRKRFAVVVSKKVLKGAVGRNRIRRRVYEVIRGELGRVGRAVDCIFVVYSREVGDMPFLELRQLILGLMVEAQVI